MSVSTCPVATIHAPAERVWHLLSQPHNYALWYDAQTLSITPEGPAKPGQQIRAQTSEFGGRWPRGPAHDGACSPQKLSEEHEPAPHTLFAGDCGP